MEENAVILLGLLLLLVVAAIVLVMVMGGAAVPDQTLIDWPALGISWGPSALLLFLIGAGTMVLLLMAGAGTRRRVAKSQELRRLRKMENQQARSPQDGYAPATSSEVPLDGPPPAR
jgi:uncharacterized membrane protein YciS (DUF1049 family)